MPTEEPRRMPASKVLKSLERSIDALVQEIESPSSGANRCEAARVLNETIGQAYDKGLIDWEK